MSSPELEFEIDEFGCIRYRVTNEGALLSKDEKEFIIDYVTRMQAENAKLRELVVSYDSALNRMCNQMQGCVDCRVCILGKDYGDDSCAIDELREAAYAVKVELE